MFAVIHFLPLAIIKFCIQLQGSLSQNGKEMPGVILKEKHLLLTGQSKMSENGQCQTKIIS